MSDYGLFIIDGLIDAGFVVGDIAEDNGLETAVLISLFADARATPDLLDPIDQDGDLRGFWGDIAIPGDSTGSLLWTLKRAKQLQSTLAQARGYCKTALQWLIDDAVADLVDVQCEFIKRGWLGIQVDIYRPGSANPVSYRYNYEWQTQLMKVA